MYMHMCIDERDESMVFMNKCTYRLFCKFSRPYSYTPSRSSLLLALTVHVTDTVTTELRGQTEVQCPTTERPVSKKSAPTASNNSRP